MIRAAVIVVVATSASCPAAVPAIPSLSTQLTGKNYVIELSAGPCVADAACSVRAVIHAGGETHINTEYPHRFEPAKTSATSWSELKAFTVDNERQGTLTTTFTAPGRGDADIDGHLRFSVCSADHCQIETVLLKVQLPVGPRQTT